MTKQEKVRSAENNKDISTDEIKQDIGDTQAEIDTMEREIKAFRILGDRWSIMRADAREKTKIPERKEFIARLEAILEVRENAEIFKI